MQMTAVLLWGLASACALAVIYPYAVYPLMLRCLPQRPLTPCTFDSDGGREFALLFCAYNEAMAMPDKIANLAELRSRYPHLEILVYDDLSSDRTAEMLEEAGLGVHVVRGTGRTGKAHGMKLLASMTRREFLVFTDANVELAPDTFDRLRHAYGDAKVGGVCGVLHYIDDAGTPTANAGGLYWRLEELVKTLESRAGNVMGADGSIFSIRRALYPDFPDTVLDDMTVSMSVVFQGNRLIKDSSVVATERLVASRADDNQRRIRIAMRCYHTHMWMRPQLRAMTLGDRWRWWSHRYLRWHGAHFMVLGLLAGIIALLVSGHWLALIVFAAIAVLLVLLGTRIEMGPMSTIIHLVASILVTGVGVTRAQRGQTMATWKPPTR